jgi:hypothetical protein
MINRAKTGSIAKLTSSKPGNKASSAATVVAEVSRILEGLILEVAGATFLTFSTPCLAVAHRAAAVVVRNDTAGRI